MLSHKNLSNWYAQLAEHLEAGTPIADALLYCAGPPRKDRARLAANLKSGLSIHETLKRAPGWLPYTDRILITAAAETGTLPETLGMLSERHKDISSVLYKTLLGLIYPLGIYHVVALLLPLMRMIDYESGFQWDLRQFLGGVLLLLLPLWLLISCVLLLIKTNNPLLPRIQSLIPFLRKYRKTQALADFSFALGVFFSTGHNTEHSWIAAAKISRDPGIKKATVRLKPSFEQGNSPLDTLKSLKVFPPDFIAFYSAGSKSGKLDQMLIKSSKHYQTEANRSMTLAMIFYPSVLFAVIVTLILVNVFKIFGGYLDMIKNLAG